jgi:transcription elongation factor Elf1
MKKTKANTTVRVCPKCGSKKVVEIVYGYVLSEYVDMAKEGKIWLGGCCICEDSKNTHCLKCGNEFDCDWDDEDIE